MPENGPEGAPTGLPPGSVTEPGSVTDPGSVIAPTSVREPSSVIEPGSVTEEAQPMSFLERAKQMAGEAAQQAREAAQRGQATFQDPATAEKARNVLRRARRGVVTAIDRIDPGVLADIVIKATALQERANNSLRTKGSLYRISEVVIGASFPPTINFSITRIGEKDEKPTGEEILSSEMAGSAPRTDGTIQALDGSTIHESELLDDDDLEPSST